MRIEQLAPFPYDLVAASIQRFPNAEVVWVQEEPKNMGAWSYVRPRFETAVRDFGLRQKRSASCDIRSGYYIAHADDNDDGDDGDDFDDDNHEGDDLIVLCYNRYVGRPPSASPAAGSFKQHLEEQAVFVKEALFFENADTATTTSASPSS